MIKNFRTASYTLAFTVYILVSAKPIWADHKGDPRWFINVFGETAAKHFGFEIVAQVSESFILAKIPTAGKINKAIDDFNKKAELIGSNFRINVKFNETSGIEPINSAIENMLLRPVINVPFAGFRPSGTDNLNEVQRVLNATSN